MVWLVRVEDSVKLMFFSFSIVLSACGEKSELEFNEEPILINLLSSHSADIQAKKIFLGVIWEYSCFREGSEVHIDFFSGDILYSIVLDREKYYMEENYVPGSPAGKCIRPDSYLIFERDSVLYEPIIKVKYYDKDVLI